MHDNHVLFLERERERGKKKKLHSTIKRIFFLLDLFSSLSTISNSFDVLSAIAFGDACYSSLMPVYYLNIFFIAYIDYPLKNFLAV